MKKTVLLIMLIIFICGCQSAEEKRAALELRFQQAYPDNWQQKLLEYEIEEERLKKERALRNVEAYQGRLNRASPQKVRIVP